MQERGLMLRIGKGKLNICKVMAEEVQGGKITDYF
jgi:hypothetical protein